MIRRKACRLVLVGLFSALLGSTVSTASAAPPVLESAVPSVKAVLHDNWAYTTMPPPGLMRYMYSHVPRYTLQVSGTNLRPGAQIQMALIDTRDMSVLHRGSASTQPQFEFSLPLRRAVLNPEAGSFQYEALVHASVPQSVPVHLWCRAASHMDFHEVARA